MKAEQYFTGDVLRAVNEAITAAEKQTSGEVRLFIEDNCTGDVLDRSAFLFHELKMDATKEHNGVLFYLAMKSHKFAILGDAGINSQVPKDFWEAIKVKMQSHFVDGDFSQGLTIGINLAGDALQKYFPYHKDDKDELSNDIVFGK